MKRRSPELWLWSPTTGEFRHFANLFWMNLVGACRRPPRFRCMCVGPLVVLSQCHPYRSPSPFLSPPGLPSPSPHLLRTFYPACVAAPGGSFSVEFPHSSAPVSICLFVPAAGCFLCLYVQQDLWVLPGPGWPAATPPSQLGLTSLTVRM